MHPNLRADLDRHRYRFRVAHELAHTLFYARPGGRPRRRFAVTGQEEAFCDRVARALLLPDQAVLHRAPTPTALLCVQREYDVSLEMCVRAFAEVHDDVFLGLLVARGSSAPSIRPQWVSSAELPARWWAADWLQGALRHATATTDHSGLIGVGRRALRCLWRALPQRRQILITAAPAST
ncbi:MAG: ImmA/IrrE family metallo-endopeptidase [Gaiellaceae bacterium]